jgi:hypothetical protein
MKDMQGQNFTGPRSVILEFWAAATPGSKKSNPRPSIRRHIRRHFLTYSWFSRKKTRDNLTSTSVKAVPRTLTSTLKKNSAKIIVVWLRYTDGKLPTMRSQQFSGCSAAKQWGANQTRARHMCASYAPSLSGAHGSMRTLFACE